jgi:hypothetical protein
MDEDEGMGGPPRARARPSSSNRAVVRGQWSEGGLSRRSSESEGGDLDPLTPRSPLSFPGHEPTVMSHEHIG